jgi:hypothetical protein
MPGRRSTLRLALPITLAVSGPASRHRPQADPSEPKRCAGVRDVGPTGRDPADANQLTAWRTTCATARTVAR